MVCVFTQLDIDFATICQQNGYPQCSNKLFEMWPLICDKLLAAKPHSSSMVYCYILKLTSLAFMFTGSSLI